MELSVVKVPSPATLKKYGLDAESWVGVLERQGNGEACPICLNVPSTGRMVTDHFHAKKFKAMSPEDKRKWVRGVVCWYCNHAYLGRGITVERARRVVAYLEAFEARRPDKEKA